MPYGPHAADDRARMLEAIGVGTIDALFDDIPAALRAGALRLDEPEPELELTTRLQDLAGRNRVDLAGFLGAGAYRHWTPAVVDQMLLRGEWYTAYTPYQPEVSQGTLQSIYEYQSLLAELTGLDVVSASHYDGGAATAEAALMTCRATRRDRVLVSQGVHPHYREALATYAAGAGLVADQVPLVADGPSAGTTDLAALGRLLADSDRPVAGVVVAQPNVLGLLEDMAEVGRLAHAAGALFVSVVEPVSLAVLAPPGEYGADIAAGEGQPLGIPLQYGGPYLGIVACTDALMRQIPGRLVGMTTDQDGRRAFVMTMRAREQDIRREKAASNICTNQALLALAASMYLAAHRAPRVARRGRHGGGARHRAGDGACRRGRTPHARRPVPQRARRARSRRPVGPCPTARPGRAGRHPDSRPVPGRAGPRGRPARVRHRGDDTRRDRPLRCRAPVGACDHGDDGRSPVSVVGERLQPTIFELSRPGRGGGKIPHPPKDALDRIPASARRVTPAALPELAEPDVVRHFVNLSQLNYSVDTGFYPLGSCTMKYNPKLNEWAARLPGFADLHPMAPDAIAQGTLALLCELEAMLAEISGMDAVTLQPAAGAHGELTGILMIRAYHRSRGDVGRDEVLVPDSSHGTNPATATMAGFRTITIPSAPDGGVDLDAFRAALGPRTAAIMITNPSTLGLFERRIGELLDATHEAGALAYMDGANLNAIMGRFRPGAAGFDVMHFNTHKTFSTPHGGGGPGAGPVGVRANLVPFLPAPRVLRESRRHVSASSCPVSGRRPSGGCAPSSAAPASSCARTPTSALTARLVCARPRDDAVLSANYLKARLRDAYLVPFDRPCKHEFVASASEIKRRTGVRTLDIAKRLIDKGYHPPTIYFPLTVDEAMLIEPTETESLETLDAFADALIEIAREAETDPEVVKSAPHVAPVKRLDEATAARQPNLRWRGMTGAEMPCPGLTVRGAAGGDLTAPQGL